MLLRLTSSNSGCWENDMAESACSTPHFGQQSPPDLDPSDKEQEEDCNIGQHLELAMKFGEELGHVQTVVEH